MDSPSIAGVDLNHPWSLLIYTQLLEFKFDLHRSNQTLENPNFFQQRTVQCLAHKLGLEYEYCLSIRTARVSRPIMVDSGFGELFPSSFKPANINDEPPGMSTILPNGLVGSASSEYLATSVPNQMSPRQHSYFLAPELPTGLNSSMMAPFASDAQGWTADVDMGLGIEGYSSPSLELLIPQPDYDYPATFSSQSNFRNGVPFSEISPASSSLHQNQRSLSMGALSEESPISGSVLDNVSPWFSDICSSTRASSVSSMQSQNGRSPARKIFRGSSSIHSKVSSGYGEIVFSADPTRSPSRASGSSGRRGPMDKFAKAAMNAVKKVGACWRCKFLKKTCDPEAICLACPKRARDSQWQSVGCRRGGLETEMPPVVLCPNAERDSPLAYDSSLEGPRSLNQSIRKETELRDHEIVANATSLLQEIPNHLLTVSEAFDTPLIRPTRISSQSAPPLPLSSALVLTHLPDAFQPLEKCILAISWELKRSPWSQDILLHQAGLDDCNIKDIERLTRSAALYQVTLDSNHLITQSLICLRSSLEVLRLPAPGSIFPGQRAHDTCHSFTGCKIECISEFKNHLESYLQELSRVLFKKENVRSNDWWLSVFYSLCIQGLVRLALCKIVNNSEILDPERIFATQYLYLVVRLIIARSGSYDPLLKDWQSSVLESPKKDWRIVEHFQNAQVAVNRPSWASQGIYNSGGFLRKLFEDNGETLATKEIGNLSQPSQRFGEDFKASNKFMTLPALCTLSLEDLRDPISCHREPPPDDDMISIDANFVPRKQDLRFDGDLYNPIWARGSGKKLEGWCGFCSRWLSFKDLSFWYDKSFSHGISATTGRPFETPQRCRPSEGNPDVWEGLCRRCEDWIPLVFNKKKGMSWFRHAYECQSRPDVKNLL